MTSLNHLELNYEDLIVKIKSTNPKTLYDIVSYLVTIDKLEYKSTIHGNIINIIDIIRNLDQEINELVKKSSMDAQNSMQKRMRERMDFLNSPVYVTES